MTKGRTFGDTWRGSAVISACEKYRYLLERIAPGSIGRRVVWIMLNPSTADAEKNDNTVRRCMAYTAAWGYDALAVVNLYGYRTSSPAVLRKVFLEHVVGPQNDSYVRAAVRGAGLVIAAWGSPGPMTQRRWDVLRIAHEERAKLHVLRFNQPQDATLTREPGHPLRLSKDLQPIPWDYLPNDGPGAGG
jgi:hypothetical protein